MSWADRIAYVCHDFEDAVAAGIVAPDDAARASCASAAATGAAAQLGAFIGGDGRRRGRRPAGSG